MSTERDTTRIVRSWLRTEENESADRVLGIVLDQLDMTQQRRVTSWPARRLPEMNNTAKLALGAAAVVVVTVLGINFLLPGGPRIGGPGSTADPTAASPSVPASGPPRAPAEGSAIPAGTYVMAPFDGPNDAIRFTVTVPDGWVSLPGHSGLAPAAPRGTEAPEGMGLVFIMVNGLYSRPVPRQRSWRRRRAGRPDGRRSGGRVTGAVGLRGKRSHRRGAGWLLGAPNGPPAAIRYRLRHVR